jgi:hypothetical protein
LSRIVPFEMVDAALAETRAGQQRVWALLSRVVESRISRMGRIKVRVIRRDHDHHQRRLAQRGLPTGHHAAGAQPHHRLSGSRDRHPVPPALGDRDRVLRVEVDHPGRARAARPYPGRNRAAGLRPAGDLSAPCGSRSATPRSRPDLDPHRGSVTVALHAARDQLLAPPGSSPTPSSISSARSAARSWTTSCPAADRAPTPTWSNERSPNTPPAPSKDATADPPAAAINIRIITATSPWRQ